MAPLENEVDPGILEKLKLPNAGQWLNAFTAAGANAEEILQKIDAEIATYIQKLPTDPVERQAILDSLDPVTRALVEAGDPIHVRIDTVVGIIQNSLGSRGVASVIALAATELVDLLNKKRSATQRKALSLA